MNFFNNTFLKDDNRSDSDLVNTYKESKDIQTMTVLFHRYTGMLFGLCRKYFDTDSDSEDAVMEIYELLPDLLFNNNINNFRGWLYVVARNHCLMKLRKSKIKLVAIDENEFQESFVKFDPFEHPVQEKEQILNTLEHCISQLKKEQKSCIQLFYIQKKCYAEIVEATKFELKKVKSYIQNGKRNLKICMENNNEE